MSFAAHKMQNSKELCQTREDRRATNTSKLTSGADVVGTWAWRRSTRPKSALKVTHQPDRTGTSSHVLPSGSILTTSALVAPLKGVSCSGKPFLMELLAVSAEAQKKACGAVPS